MEKDKAMRGKSAPKVLAISSAALFMLAQSTMAGENSPPHAESRDAISLLIEKTLTLAEQKTAATLEYIRKNASPTKMMPKSTLTSGGWELVAPDDPGEWTAGFFPGCLWQLYRARGTHLADARRFTAYLSEVRAPNHRPAGAVKTGNDPDLHIDLGFDMTNSYLNQLILDRDAASATAAKAILIRAAKDLASLFDPKAGAVVDRASWRVSGTETFLPLDYIMNIEPLFWAAKTADSADYAKIAIAHATTTLKSHLRPDGGTWHHVIFNGSGEVKRKATWQGYADSSTWARGQAWAIHGFTDTYRESKDPEFLAAAEKVASYFIRRLPEDQIPPWDFDDPAPEKPKDSSAAAVAASGLLELSQFAKDKATRIKFKSVADRILLKLMSDYVNPDPARLGILQHGVGNYPHHTEIDVSLIYGDYYFLQALNRRRDLGAAIP